MRFLKKLTLATLMLLMIVAGGLGNAAFAAGLDNSVDGTFTASSPTRTFSNRAGDYYADEYTVTVTRTDGYVTHEWRSSFFDAYLYLFDTDGTLLASNDDASGSPNSRIDLSGYPIGTELVVVPTMYNDTIFASGSLPANYTLTMYGASRAGLPPPLEISLSEGSVNLTRGVAMTAVTATATNGDASYSFSVSPALPAGLSINATTGEISGTPTTAQAATTYTVTVTDGTSATDTATVSITIANPALTLSLSEASVSLTGGDAMTPITATAAGGDEAYTFSVSPALPAGLSINTANGEISGTPTTAQVATTYTVTVTDGALATQTASIAIAVNQAAGVPVAADPVVETTDEDGNPIVTTETIPADDVTSATITIRLRDANGNFVTTGGAVVILTTNLGTLRVNPSGTTLQARDNGDGSYSARLTSDQPGEATVTMTVNGVASPGSIRVLFGQSNDAALSSLTPSNGTLTPSFSADVTSYEITVNPDVSAITLTAVSGQADARIVVNGVAVASGVASTPVAVATGTTLVTTVVTAPDGVTTRSYGVTVTRPAGPAELFAAAEAEIRQVVQTTELRTLRRQIGANERFMQGASARFIEQQRQGQDDTLAAIGEQYAMLGTDLPFSFNADVVTTAQGVRVSSQGDFAQRIGSASGSVSRFVTGEFDITRIEDGSTTGAFNARFAQNHRISDETLLGFFAGGEISRGTISGRFSGDSESYGAFVGGYGVTRLGEAMFADGYLSAGLSRNNLEISDGVLALDGDYTTRSVNIGGTLTGVMDYSRFEIWPQLSLSHGHTWIGRVPFDATALGFTVPVSLDAGSVSLTILSLRPELRIPFDLNGDLRHDGVLSITPRAFCEWVRGTDVDMDCGGGMGLGLTGQSEDGLHDFSLRVGYDRAGSSERSNLTANYTLRF